MLMKILADACQMRRMDERTIHEKGIASMVLMERAALAVAGYIRENACCAGKRILVVCGSGNNGGDGAAIARILCQWGMDAACYLAGNMEKATQELKAQIRTAEACQVPCYENEPSFEHYQVLVDALFGAGLKRPVSGAFAGLLERMNKAQAIRIAVDLPSGVDVDTGAVRGAAFRADVTIMLGCGKRGLYLYPGRSYAGKKILADIGIYPEEDVYDCFLPETEDLSRIMERPPDGNKGTFGKVLAVTGSVSMAGAAYFCSHAALCAGAGMVKVQSSPENRIPLMSLLPEAMMECSMPEEDGFSERWLNCLAWCDSLIIGPGLGTDRQAEERVLWFLKEGYAQKKKIVLDADGLNLLSRHPEWREYLGPNVILTPHMGEMSRLTGVCIEELMSDRISYSKELAKETGSVCVLKDACTVIASPDGKCWINPAGNSGMATAGSGDVLAGLLGGLEARLVNNNLETEPDSLGLIAACGVLLHGLAGDAAADAEGENAMTARSLIDQLKNGKWERVLYERGKKYNG